MKAEKMEQKEQFVFEKLKRELFKNPLSTDKALAESVGVSKDWLDEHKQVLYDAKDAVLEQLKTESLDDLVKDALLVFKGALQGDDLNTRLRVAEKVLLAVTPKKTVTDLTVTQDFEQTSLADFLKGGA